MAPALDHLIVRVNDLDETVRFWVLDPNRHLLEMGSYG